MRHLDDGIVRDPSEVKMSKRGATPKNAAPALSGAEESRKYAMRPEARTDTFVDGSRFPWLRAFAGTGDPDRPGNR